MMLAGRNAQRRAARNDRKGEGDMAALPRTVVLGASPDLARATPGSPVRLVPRRIWRRLPT